uniref:Slc16a-20 n=1 Tax=Schmidtea mediterranea TaxID=79327 RepID=A0A0H3YF15_SCHMD|nr:slc16a-20 [Schmidtea mediterranea]
MSKSDFVEINLKDDLNLSKIEERKISIVEPVENVNEQLKEDERDCPDGGYGWVVMVFALLIRIVCGGLLVTFGIFMTPLVEEYKTSQSTISWIASLMSAMNLAATPLATLLAMKLSDRVIVVIGSIISGISFAAPFFYSPLWFMFLSSILTGIGMAITIMNVTVVLTKYFDKKLSIINGIFTSGTGIASFIITPIFNKIVSLYGWRLAMLVYGILFFFCAVCSLAFKELPKKTRKVIEVPLETERESKQNNSEVINIEEKDETFRVPRMQNFISAMNMHSYVSSDLKISDGKVFTSLQHIKQREECLDRSQAANLLSNMPVSTLLGMSISENLNNKNSQKNKKPDNETNFLTNLGHDTTFIYAKQKAMDMNITESKASFLLIAIGIGNTVGRLLFGFLGSRKSIKIYLLYLASLVFAGGFIIFSRFAFTYPLMLVYAIGFGLFIGAYTTLTSVVLLEIIGIQNFTKGLGFAYFVQAIGLLLCSPISGFIYDRTQTLDWSFISSGLLITTSGFLLFLGYASKTFRKSQRN